MYAAPENVFGECSTGQTHLKTQYFAESSCKIPQIVKCIDVLSFNGQLMTID